MVNSLQGLAFVRQKRPFVCHALRVFANRCQGWFIDNLRVQLGPTYVLMTCLASFLLAYWLDNLESAGASSAGNVLYAMKTKKIWYVNLLIDERS